MSYPSAKDYRPFGPQKHKEIDGKMRLVQENEIWEEIYLVNRGGQCILKDTGRTIWLEVPTRENIND